MNVYVHALFSTAPKKKHDTNSWSAEHLQPLFSSRHFSVEIRCIVLQHPCDPSYTNAFIAQHRPLKETMLGNILDEMSNETTFVISSCLCQTLYCSLFFTIQSCERPITNLFFFYFQHSARPLQPIKHLKISTRRSTVINSGAHSGGRLQAEHTWCDYISSPHGSSIALCFTQEWEMLQIFRMPGRCQIRFIVKQRACFSVQPKN